ncbi:16S rRNA (cytidine(1402)-2'-O)-methyltransferase [Rickettsiella endosymbiont of Litargus connexus]|jgi:16S rRNA (cytidine1402-2'-O)-methyltransferase|uniref:16S rRNA (cytidine(1402)-2'-O)-methyltransferase n=1 Tax=Rickettsiella endosymbiont of Litargus connexus TaxID=3066237 RepID=UPI0027EA9C02|nr:16S rRNA (cytidine(1402)-2'-O)-methyltransferase [Gammaproteobacteria bacterium]MCH9754490.1 16S rRNA (cytidine(1402)-2'-O)-methyltransferase [Gammaproteobacteria bacterium]MDD4892683.1 16S rRNA (cytidine(1402)-2'-O)-methyltransferase [Candidatus Rickettsiella isopodorum]MDD5161532.1 16S rRNA (cytidine(1402)-2'-O)-methyltransferase [Candidatus Rickettsiella isopodorum]MDQ5899567.1 Ribosomal small subunit methyltransferase [Pseudomonadota bacterium]
MSKIPGLYVVATPIGNLEDCSTRAIEILQTVDQIAAEDTRHSQKLLKYFGITTPLISLHEHNETISSKILLNCLKKNRSIALISDAGTPLINDPGYRLVKLAHQHGIPVIPIPGPCALITALCASGLPCDRFIFEGFLPGKNSARLKKLQEFLYETRTIIFYEAPHRILELIDDMLAVFGPKRYVVLARELTKAFETIHGDNLEKLNIWLNSDKNQQKGEFVILVEGAEYLSPYEIDRQRILGILLAELPIKQATSLAAKITHAKKNKLYALALAITDKSHE